jgi:hypothetical protein
MPRVREEFFGHLQLKGSSHRWVDHVLSTRLLRWKQGIDACLIPLRRLDYAKGPDRRLSVPGNRGGGWQSSVGRAAVGIMPGRMVPNLSVDDRCCSVRQSDAGPKR